MSESVLEPARPRTDRFLLTGDRVRWSFSIIDSRAAISATNSIRSCGELEQPWSFFARLAFWRIDYSTEFHRHLPATYRCVPDNDHLVAFDLQSS